LAALMGIHETARVLIRKYRDEISNGRFLETNGDGNQKISVALGWAYEKNGRYANWYTYIYLRRLIKEYITKIWFDSSVQNYRNSHSFTLYALHLFHMGFGKLFHIQFHATALEIFKKRNYGLTG
jgi:hypothetical protein